MIVITAKSAKGAKVRKGFSLALLRALGVLGGGEQRTGFGELTGGNHGALHH